MYPNSLKYTTFISEFGTHEYLAMPMGLRNAWSIFQRMMDKVLDGLIGEICYVYHDDIIVFSEDLKEHEQRFKSVIERLKKNDLQVKLKKCEFLQSTILILCHVISHCKVEKSLHLIKAIATAEVPKTMTHLRSWV